jgi:hypothetical protein
MCLYPTFPIPKHPLDLIPRVDKQPTVDAIVTPLRLYENSIKKEAVRLLCPLTCRFIVSSAFFAIFTHANHDEKRLELIPSILKAIVKSDVIQDVLDLLLDCIAAIKSWIESGDFRTFSGRWAI